MQQDKDCQLVQRDLQDIGKNAEILQESTQGPPFVVFEYTIETGPNRGEHVMMGVGFQETGYPEYPPHWILSTRRLPGTETPGKQFQDGSGREWYGYSRNFGQLWDRSRQKNMKAFIQIAIRPFWRQ